MNLLYYNLDRLNICSIASNIIPAIIKIATSNDENKCDSSRSGSQSDGSTLRDTSEVDRNQLHPRATSLKQNITAWGGKQASHALPKTYCSAVSSRFAATVFCCHNHCSCHGYCNTENDCVREGAVS